METYYLQVFFIFVCVCVYLLWNLKVYNRGGHPWYIGLNN